jgi:hypothetical protein
MKAFLATWLFLHTQAWKIVDLQKQTTCTCGTIILWLWRWPQHNRQCQLETTHNNEVHKPSNKLSPLFQLFAIYVKKFVYSMAAHTKNRSNFYLAMSYKFALDVKHPNFCSKPKAPWC